MAYAVVMHVKLPEQGDDEEGLKMLTEIVVPHAKSQEGFQNGTWVNDRTGDGMGIVVFATEEQAKAAQEALKPPPGGPELVSSEIYAVGAQA